MALDRRAAALKAVAHRQRSGISTTQSTPLSVQEVSIHRTQGTNTSIARTVRDDSRSTIPVYKQTCQLPQLPATNCVCGQLPPTNSGLSSHGSAVTSSAIPQTLVVGVLNSLSSIPTDLLSFSDEGFCKWTAGVLPHPTPTLINPSDYLPGSTAALEFGCGSGVDAGPGYGEVLQLLANATSAPMLAPYPVYTKHFSWRNRCSFSCLRSIALHKASLDG